MVKGECVRTKLCPCSLGVAFGFVTAFFMLALAWAGYFWHFETPVIEQLATIYKGYAATLVGGLYGAFWGFLKGFIFGGLVGLVYNFCICCCCSKASGCCSPKKK
jgi:hypothetical protein